MKYYYAAESDKGLNVTYESPCWMVHAFSSKTRRDEFLKSRPDITEIIDAKTAYRIAPELKTKSPADAWRVVDHG